MNKHTIAFEGHSILVELLLKHAGTAPLIDIAANELAENFDTAVVNHGATDVGTIIVYKVNGKYLALQGVPMIKAHLDKNVTTFKGKLISKQLLKKIETVAVPLKVQNQRAEAALDVGRHEYRPGDGFGTIGSRMQRPDFYERPMSARPQGLTEPRDNMRRRG